MYTLKVSHDKSLITVRSKSIYQGENNGDTIDIFIPKEYNNVDISTAIVRLEYMLPNGTTNFVLLNKSPEDYGRYSMYQFNITKRFTTLDGRVTFWLTLFKNANEMILKTSQNYFDVNKSIDVTTDIPDITEILLKLQELDETKADNITMSSAQELQLTAHDIPIGDKVGINKVINLDE